ncbi:MAG TPA: DUF885 family protein [Thermoanaerobaculia bacterium]|nr:DUF885 family protein [Thermoanaerobaculia bacterium]
MKKMIVLIVIAVILMTGVAVSAERSAEDLDTRRKALDGLLTEQWEYVLATSPEYASILGDKRYNDKVSDLSEAAILRDLAMTKTFLRRFEAIDTFGFSDQEKLNKRLMVEGLRNQIEDSRFRNWLMPVNQMSGIHLRLPSYPQYFSFESVKDYEDYLVRMRQQPRQLDQTVERMRKGMAQRLMPPKFLLEKVADQAAQIGGGKPEESPFALPLSKFPEGIAPAERDRLRAVYLKVIGDEVLPAYQRFARFVREEYAPKGRTEVGVWSLPDGAARYALLAKRSTTTDLTPEEIHQIGVREVARIEGEMLEIAKKVGFIDLKSFRESIENNPELKAKSGEHLLELYRKYIDQMWVELPKLFGRLPKAQLVVEAVEEYRQATAAGAEYNRGTPDGSRPGKVKVNTGDATSRKIITAESTGYHEGVPGHHMQIAIAQELTGLPTFRQQGGHTAYVEGWALYSERLGKEVGFYQDPYMDYGRLEDEMLRAIRLVVDTGLHYKKWNREQVVQFFRDHSAADEVDVQSETDRYIVWPGQALGYKIGQLKIVELRERARAALGPAFDIRKFHDEVLGNGSLPMNVLEERIDDWIRREKGRAAA